MTETGAAGGELPADPDDLAEALLHARAQFLRSQELIRMAERGIGPGPELDGHRERLDAMADRYLDIERRAKEALLVLCVQAAHAGKLTPRLARQALVAVSAGDDALAYFDAHPERTTRTVAAGAANPDDLEGMLTAITRDDEPS
jgi:hypothetical protein